MKRLSEETWDRLALAGSLACMIMGLVIGDWCRVGLGLLALALVVKWWGKGDESALVIRFRFSRMGLMYILAAFVIVILFAAILITASR
jgi:hypothetical protein